MLPFHGKAIAFLTRLVVGKSAARFLCGPPPAFMRIASVYVMFYAQWSPSLFKTLLQRALNKFRGQAQRIHSGNR